MKTLREHCWIWGHPARSLYEHFGIKKDSDMPPVEGTYYLGARNTFLVPMDVPVDRHHETELAKDVATVGWSINYAWEHPENVTEVCNLAKEYKNIRMGIFDDFFSESNEKNNYLNYTTERMETIRDELHAAGLEFWVVLYTEEFGKVDMDVIRKYLKVFDGVSLWFWNEQEVLEDYDKLIDIFFDLTEGKKRMVGCYLYDFGAEAPATGKAVVYQLEKAREMIQTGTIEGVILHTNAVVAKAGVKPYEAVEACVKWMEENGDEVIG